MSTAPRRRKEARPAELLEAALDVFAEKGFAAARMDDIAARAGVAKGTVYLYFPGKEAVFRPGGKVRHPCPQCGLQRHERDAVHCKACGLLLNIPNDED